MHNYGVMTASLSPIDLTASVLLAYMKMNMSQPVCINWIVEKHATSMVFDKLTKYANYFEIPINVIRQEEIPALNPSLLDLETFLGNLCDTHLINSNRRIRLHHGSLLLRKDGTKRNFRYFEKSESGEIILYENNMVPCPLSSINCESLFLVGSINLCFLAQSYELSHLPWYCIDSDIFPLSAEEIITPPEGCSNNRFGKESVKLNPSGYSIFDYNIRVKSNIYGDVDSIMRPIDSTIKGRNTKRSNLNNNYFMEIINELKIDFWGNCYFPIDSIVDIYRSALKLSRICKMANSGRFYGDKFGSIAETDEMKKYCISKAEMIDRIIQTSLDINIDTINYSQLYLPQIANIMKERAILILDKMMKYYYYDLKATIPNLVSYCDSTEFKRIINLFLLKRGNQCTQMVKGSVFDYEIIRSEVDN